MLFIVCKFELLSIVTFSLKHFIISCKEDLLATNYLGFDYLGKYFTFNFETFLLDRSLFIDNFPPSSLHMSYHCLLVSIDSDKKSAKYLIGALYYVMTFFPCCFHNFLFSAVFQHFDCYVFALSYLAFCELLGYVD